MDLRFRMALSIFNAITLCSIILNYMNTPIAIIISLVFSSLSTLIDAGYRTFEVPSKITSSQTSWLQLLDLYNTYNNKLLKNNLSSDEYENMLNDLNTRTGMIFDSSLPIDIAESNEYNNDSMPLKQHPPTTPSVDIV